MRQRPLLERLMEKVIVNENGCWIFTGSLDRGYGQIQRGDGFNYPIRTHVASWMVHIGEVPEGLEVCHKCSFKACCNPKHLYIGTHKDNMGDRRKYNLDAEFDDWADERPRPQPSLPSLASSKFAQKFPQPEPERTFAFEELDYPWEEGVQLARKYINTWLYQGGLRRI